MKMHCVLLRIYFLAPPTKICAFPISPINSSLPVKCISIVAILLYTLKRETTPHIEREIAAHVSVPKAMQAKHAPVSALDIDCMSTRS